MPAYCCLLLFVCLYVGFCSFIFCNEHGYILVLCCVVFGPLHAHAQDSWVSMGKFHESIVAVAVVYLFMSCLTSASLERTRTCHMK